MVSPLLRRWETGCSSWEALPFQALSRARVTLTPPTRTTGSWVSLASSLSPCCFSTFACLKPCIFLWAPKRTIVILLSSLEKIWEIVHRDDDQISAATGFPSRTSIHPYSECSGCCDSSFEKLDRLWYRRPSVSPVKLPSRIACSCIDHNSKDTRTFLTCFDRSFSSSHRRKLGCSSTHLFHPCCTWSREEHFANLMW